MGKYRGHRHQHKRWHARDIAAWRRQRDAARMRQDFKDLQAEDDSFLGLECHYSYYYEGLSTDEWFGDFVPDPVDFVPDPVEDGPEEHEDEMDYWQDAYKPLDSWYGAA